MDHTMDSGNNSPRVGARPFTYDQISDEEDEYANEHERDDAGSESSWEGKQSKSKNVQRATDVFGEQGTSGEATPSSGTQEGMLPRDIQRKTAYYDYAAEKQMSQADMKLFYQRSQLEAHRTGGSSYSPQGSPIIRSRTFSNKEADQQLSGSLHSVNSGLQMAQR